MDLRASRPARRVAGRLPALAAIAALGALVLPAAASAQLPQPASLTKPPPFHALSARRAIAVANADPKLRAERSKRGPMAAFAYLDGPLRWQVSYFQGGKERAQVIVDDPSAAVVESWTGWQVAWKMARGYSGQFGGKLDAPYVWLPLCVLFLLPFVDPRRPFRMLHLDLLALLAFGASHFFFNRGEISVSVPLVYPVLAYLLVRMLWVGFRPRRAGRGRLVPLIPVTWLALAVLFLVGFRVALNVADSSVIDVGYSGVVGAHRIATGHGLYSGRFAADDEHGDTYGPVNYLLYLPFERVLGSDAQSGDLAAGHGAAIAFDLLTLLGLLVLGRRLRAGPEGRDLGIALAFAWSTYPYAAFALQANSNDSAVAMLVVWALVALAPATGRGAGGGGARLAAARGALTALAAAAKLAPAALAPLLARGRSPSRRSVVLFAAAFVACTIAAFAPFVPHGGIARIWDRTLGYQAGRESPFSIWGQHPSLGTVHVAVEIAAIGLALLLAFVPRGPRTTAQVAALGAAILIALQLGAVHWFYLYIPWFAALVLVALFAADRAADDPPAAPWLRQDADAAPEPTATAVPA